jgi:hypothetical protein
VAANNTIWVLVKLIAGQLYQGVWLLCTNAVAGTRAALYGTGLNAPKLTERVNTVTTLAGAYTYITFTNGAGASQFYTPTTSEYAYIGILSTSAAITYYTWDHGNTNFGKTATNDTLNLRCCTSTGTAFPATFTGTVTARSTVYLCGLF